jgi:hypothetical protein
MSWISWVTSLVAGSIECKPLSAVTHTKPPPKARAPDGVINGDLRCRLSRFRIESPDRALDLVAHPHGARAGGKREREGSHADCRRLIGLGVDPCQRVLRQADDPNEATINER